MSYKFSNQLKEIISYSLDEAERLGNDYIGTEHLLLALLREGDNAAIRILKSFNVDISKMQDEIELSVRSNKGHKKSLPLNVSAEQIIHGAVEEAKTLHSKKVEAEHLILSILKNSTTASAILNHIRHN